VYICKDSFNCLTCDKLLVFFSLACFRQLVGKLWNVASGHDCLWWKPASNNTALKDTKVESDGKGKSGQKKWKSVETFASLHFQVFAIFRKTFLSVKTLARKVGQVFETRSTWHALRGVGSTLCKTWHSPRKNAKHVEHLLWKENPAQANLFCFLEPIPRLSNLQPQRQCRA
jgi:hypothetical protein